MTSQSFSRPGAVDLSALSGGTGGQPGAPAGGGPGGGGFVVDVTEETFQSEIITRSASVPVVIDFWADWCQPCKQLSPVLEKLAAEYGGRFVLAKIDIDANQRIAQAAGVQSIPLVVGVLRGQIVPLFQGAVPEGQVRQFLDELLQVAAANGVAGTAQPIPGAVAEETEGPPARNPRYVEADEAIERGDVDAAITAYEKLLDQTPSDSEAVTGLARARLLGRIRDTPASVRETAAADQTDVAAQCAVADLDVAGGHVEDAFSRLVDVVRRTSGDDRDTVRRHLLELFEAVGQQDPRVTKARQALSAALF